MSQQIQFVYLSQDEYDSLNPKIGSILYFTSDTNRIYRGSELYASRYVTDMKDWANVDFKFTEITATGLTIEDPVTGEKHQVAIEGHTHDEYLTSDDIKDFITADDLKDEVEFGSIEADELKVNGKDVSLDGHTHNVSEISGLEGLGGGTVKQVKINGTTKNPDANGLVDLGSTPQGTVKQVKVNGVSKSADANGIVDIGTVLTSDANYVKKDGDTLTGFLTLHSAPTNEMHAATKGYVDATIPTVSEIQTTVEANVKGYVDGLLEGFEPDTDGDLASRVSACETKLSGVTETGITKSTGTIAELSTTTVTATTVNANTINLTGTFEIDEADVTDLNVTNLNVTGGMKIGDQLVATKPWVKSAIEEAVGILLNTEF